MFLQMAIFHSFSWLSNVPYILMEYIFLIQSSADGHLSCFHVLAIVNNAATNISVPISFPISVLVFGGCIPRSGIAGSYSNFFSKEDIQMANR